MSDTFIIRNGRVIEPATGRDELRDIHVADGTISAATASSPGNTIIIDASGMVVTPGFIDIHVHFREPGNEKAETIKSGSRSASAGGFSTVVTMPNTTPPADSAEMISWIINESDMIGLVNVLPSACITSGRKGLLLSDIRAAKAAGASALTDDGNTVYDDNLMREAMLIARELGLPVMDHALDPELAGRGVVREGPASIRMNVPGIPAAAETRIVERDIRLSQETGCSVHIQHISTARAVDLIRKARSQGIPVTGEATPHHLALTDSDIPDSDNTNYKMNPPLGNETDRQALIQGIVEGTLQAFATDHAPHTIEQKNKGILDAPFGIIGLETAIGITFTELVKSGRMNLISWLARWNAGPAEILGLPKPDLNPGSPANITILDLESEWTVDPEKFLSKSRNTPFAGRHLKGRAMYTFCKGIMTHSPVV